MRERISLYSIYLKEITTHLSSPLLPVITGIFLFISGFFFFNSMVYESLLATTIAQYQPSDGMGISGFVMHPAFSDMVLLIVMMAPLISIRLHSEEEAQVEEKPPVSNSKILLGKYLAGLSILTGIIAATSLLPALTALVTPPDWGLIICSYGGLVLLGGAIFAMRAFASSLTKYRVIATALTLGLIIIFWSVGWYSAIFPGDCRGTILEELSLANHLAPFLKGVVSLRGIAYYFEISLFFLVLTLTVANSRRKRNERYGR
jgi:ABC-2 type transport system permease protein